MSGRCEIHDFNWFYDPIVFQIMCSNVLQHTLVRDIGR